MSSAVRAVRELAALTTIVLDEKFFHVFCTAHQRSPTMFEALRQSDLFLNLYFNSILSTKRPLNMQFRLRDKKRVKATLHPKLEFPVDSILLHGYLLVIRSR
jgi:hypothetical protein